MTFREVMEMIGDFSEKKKKKCLVFQRAQWKNFKNQKGAGARVTEGM